MKVSNAPLKTAKRKNIFLTFLLLLSLPVFIYGLLQNQSFDTRNQAFDDITLSEDNPCIITFPNVNPYTLVKDQTVRMQVEAMSLLGVKSITLTDESSNKLYTKTYTDNPKNISESFSFTPKETKAYEISGVMIDDNSKSYACVISSPYDVKGIRVLANNSKPVVTSTPSKDSKPSQSIKVGDTYEYTVTVEDEDKDTINYSYSFTPNADWLKKTIIEDGGNGKLTIKFRGTPTKPASYLANIFIHDGYSKHLVGHAWIISVSPKENDIPVVKIIEPTELINITDKSPVKLTWDSSDQNHISKYQLYISSNPANEGSWKAINENIGYKVTEYNIPTDTLSNGSYKAILKAIDNQTPSGVGMDISEEFVISRQTDDTQTPDDQVILPEAQITNISPSGSDEITNTKPTIKASVIASDKATIVEDNISVKLDDKDITSDIRINKVSDSEYTIIYLPEENLSTGVHKMYVYIKDSNNIEEEKEWTFTITESQTTDTSGNINIFGYSITQRTLIIIVSGIGLIILAIVVPIIIFAVWKEKPQGINTNVSIPPVQPSNDIPIQTQANEIKSLVEENEYTAPKPLVQQPVEEIPEPTPELIPEPDSDLTKLYNQIEELKTQEEKPSEDNQQPPEPII